MLCITHNMHTTHTTHHHIHYAPTSSTAQHIRLWVGYELQQWVIVHQGLQLQHHIRNMMQQHITIPPIHTSGHRHKHSTAVRAGKVFEGVEGGDGVVGSGGGEGENSKTTHVLGIATGDAGGET